MKKEAYVSGYWQEIVDFTRGLFNAIFKTNPFLERVSKESILSDLNNLTAVTSTSGAYADNFGFTFGEKHDIYNPWSILNYLKTSKLTTYWANTSSNSLVGKLAQEGSREIKMILEGLLEEGSFHTHIDEQIVFSQLHNDESAIWSLFLAGGHCPGCP